MVTTETTSKYHQQVRCVIVIFVVIATASDVSAVTTTTVGPATVSAVVADRNLSLVLLTPFGGILGFERNAAASTLALQQAQADGLLPGMQITYVVIYFNVLTFNSAIRVSTNYYKIVYLQTSKRINSHIQVGTVKFGDEY